MMVATAAQMKELDRQAIEEYGIPSLDLMERAALGVAGAVWSLVGREDEEEGVIGGADGPIAILVGGADRKEAQREQERLQNLANALAEEKAKSKAPWVGVLCGPGNNGGDGVAAARILMGMGCRVRAFLVGDRSKMTPDERAMEEKLKEAGGALEDYRPRDQEQSFWLSQCDCLVDALFGVGLSRPIEGDFLFAVHLMQDRPDLRRVVSCDIPSGVHADTGEVLGEAVRAGVTVTFTFAKPGHYLGDGAEHTGKLRVYDIGIPDELQYGGEDRVHVETMDAGVSLPKRKPNTHKGDYGKLFLLAGSEGYTGAPVLAASAAVRSGAGLVFLGVPREIYPIVAVKCSSAMPFPLPERYGEILEKARSCDAALIGPGLGRAPKTEKLVRALLEDLEIPVVLDADGINALAGHMDILDRRKALTVLTPHDGEFARLTGTALPIQNRLKAAQSFARDYHCILVLKGHRTITAAPDGRAWINTSGNPGMAKGGSGDVLAGLITSFLGQKQLEFGSPAALTAAAVYLHGLSGDRAAQKFGEYGMTPEDLIGCIPETLKEREQ
ncbi:NAD(P)H-hydrate dehydratase [Pseudoflavonifractor capillosus]|uniref:NAD(P)H-hydrate dehydratase n=1 Tax=Pseudoflavonifractor capillosus TaxID=106588 RepID=UPI00195CAB73|nr:NAD(P)H-hydrate dehydratase [Pseudoflavonifractor capillosus]MBM6679546.1 NAD(P)H-hydrate dehydratase [Pseudoflavonifractor capillosus]